MGTIVPIIKTTKRTEDRRDGKPAPFAGDQGEVDGHDRGTEAESAGYSPGKGKGRGLTAAPFLCGLMPLFEAK